MIEKEEKMKMRKKAIKLLLLGLTIALGFAMTLALTACEGNGSGGGGSASDDPSAGMWRAIAFESMAENTDDDEVFVGGLFIEIKPDGNFTMWVNGEITTSTWERSDNTITFGLDEESFTGIVNDDLMIMDDWMNTGMRITLVREGSTPLGSSTPTASGDVLGMLNVTFDELQAYWQEYLDSQSTWSDITYEMVAEQLGIEGILLETNSDEFIEYCWFASDRGALYVVFDKETGQFVDSASSESARP